jgi:ABC-2 type transport system permease protein
MKRRTYVNAHIIAVIENEWAQMRRNRVVVLTIFVPPFLFVALALLVLFLSTWLDVNYETLEDISGPLLQELKRSPVGLSDTDAIRATLLNPFLTLFLMMPIVVTLTIASYSIIGEKQSHSLEALLATPIRTWELLVAKAFAAALPGIAATWYSFAVFALVARFTVSPVLYNRLILSPTWLIAITILTPILTMFAVCMGIIISSRAKDPQSAQQLGSFIVLPMVAILVGQVLGAVDVSLPVIAGAAGGVGLLDVALIILSVRLFRREFILTTWK